MGWRIFRSLMEETAEGRRRTSSRRQVITWAVDVCTECFLLRTAAQYSLYLNGSYSDKLFGKYMN
jgi:hypothetical protein